MQSNQKLSEILAERGSRYGDFADQAEISQAMKKVMWASPKWGALKDDQKEALEMAVHKISRILNGDPDYVDSWVDVVGYSQLVVNRLSVGVDAVFLDEETGICD